MAFDIRTTVQIEKGILQSNDQFASVPSSGTVTVNGLLVGDIGREIELTATDNNSNYRFKKWIIETTPVDIVEVVTSAPQQTYDGICDPTRENTSVSTSYFTDGKFLYIDQSGTQLASNGFYGIGSRRYYTHDSSVGLRGPLVCGQSSGGGGGNNSAQPTGDESDDSFGGRPGGGGGMDPNSKTPINQI